MNILAVVWFMDFSWLESCQMDSLALTRNHQPSDASSFFPNKSSRKISQIFQGLNLNTVPNLHFLSKNSALIYRDHCRFFGGWKIRENVVVLDFLAVDNFDFTRKIVRKNLGEKLVKMLGFCQNWIFGQKFDFSNSVYKVFSYFRIRKRTSLQSQLNTISQFRGHQRGKICVISRSWSLKKKRKKSHPGMQINLRSFIFQFSR